MNVRDWLKLFRAQTAPATVFCVVVPYLIAGGSPVNLLILVPLFTIVHYLSFGHNSLMDYWYDVHDPNKKHHPLESGKITLHSAHKVIHYGMVACTLLCVYVTYVLSPRFSLALLNLLMYIAWGHAYNDGLDKNTPHSWLSISMCFTHLAVYGWFLATGSIDWRLLIVALWAFLTIFYQIAWEGNLKDLWSEAERFNLLKTFGAELLRYGDKWVVKNLKWVALFMTSLRVPVSTSLVLVLAITLGWSWGLWTWNNILFLVMFILTFIGKSAPALAIQNIMYYELPFKREDLLEYFGLAESCEFFHFMSVLYVMGMGWLWTVLFIYGFTYFYAMNRLLWGSKFGPRV